MSIERASARRHDSPPRLGDDGHDSSSLVAQTGGEQSVEQTTPRHRGAPADGVDIAQNRGPLHGVGNFFRNLLQRDDANSGAQPARPSADIEPGLYGPPAPMIQHANPTGAPGQIGSVTQDVLKMNELNPVWGTLTGAPMAVADQPETFRESGVLFSSIGPVDGRDDTTYDFPGEARFFGLANNGTGKVQRNWVAVQNTSDEPLELTIKGTIYSKHYTETDGTVPVDYKANGGFQGPHAITAMSFMRAEDGKNGYSERTVTIPPGETMTVADTYMHPGGEVFQILDFEAGNPNQTFRMANGVTPNSPTEADLENLSNNPKAAGIPKDYYPAGDNALGRPHGIIEGGQQFTGARTIDLESGKRTGELIMATRFKNAGSTDEIGQLSPTGGVPDASHAEHPNVKNPRDPNTSDGNYGTTYSLDYTLRNDTNEPMVTDVYFTAPRQANETHVPTGGELTIPLEINGEPTPVRVNARGDGVMVASVEVPPQSSVPFNVEVTNVGNTVPPAGLEFRTR
ncbi:MAG: hypothetical protein AAFN74_19835 [Myxococcota bacterium]